jgi:hypothetical protein
MNGLTKRERIRRVVLLCCHFARDLAYYRAGHGRLTAGKYSQILVTIDGNFLDMAVIDWCKLFGEKKGRHFWGNVVADQAFEAEMLAHSNQSANQFTDYIKEMRVYRDKFLAHLDDQRVMNIPTPEHAQVVVEFYHGYVVRHEALAGDLTGLPTDLAVYYKQCFEEARSMLDRCKL